MQLNNTYPLVFGIPDRGSSRSALKISVLTVLIGSFNYFFSFYFDNYPFFLVSTILLLVHGYFSLKSSSGNLFFIFRYMLIWTLAFTTSAVWLIYNGGILVAPFGEQFQTLENTRIIVYGCLLSLSGVLIGWHLSMQLFFKGCEINLNVLKKYSKIVLKYGFLLVVFFSLLYFYISGGAITKSALYSSKVTGLNLQFSVSNVFHFIGISIILIASLEKDKINKVYLLFCVISLFLGVLAGSRADYLPQIFVLLLLGYGTGVVNAVKNKWSQKLKKFLLIALFVVPLFYLSAIFVASYRESADFKGSFDETLNEAYINTQYGHKMLYLETGNMMLGGFYSAIVNVKQGAGFLFGESYFNYFLIAPPLFLGLKRPLGLEWATDIDGIIMSQGGIFEVAESYWNFGFLGCFFVSFLISFFSGWLLCCGLNRTSFFYIVWFLVSGFMSLRGTWYQNFTYFRIATIMLMIYLVSFVFLKWFVIGLKGREN